MSKLVENNWFDKLAGWLIAYGTIFTHMTRDISSWEMNREWCLKMKKSDSRHEVCLRSEAGNKQVSQAQSSLHFSFSLRTPFFCICKVYIPSHSIAAAGTSYLTSFFCWKNEEEVEEEAITDITQNRMKQSLALFKSIRVFTSKQS